MPTILIVDDEPSIRNVLSQAFSCAGYEVETASNGDEAVLAVENRFFDAVLSDVTMPGIDGHHTVSSIRRRHPQTVSVLMSGWHIECTGACVRQEKHCFWLQKPFLPREAVAVLDRLLERTHVDGTVQWTQG